MPTLRGSCHCGQLRVVFETTAPPEELPVRACQCTFCRRHNALTTSDPGGSIVVTVGEEAATSRYRFGLKTADFLICARCGVFLGAFMEDAGEAFAVLNVNALDERTRFTQPVQPTDYDGEDVGGRIARRRLRWTRARYA